MPGIDTSFGNDSACRVIREIELETRDKKVQDEISRIEKIKQMSDRELLEHIYIKLLGHDNR